MTLLTAVPPADLDQPGDASLVYRATDADGITADLTRTVSVLAHPTLTVSVPQDLVVGGGAYEPTHFTHTLDGGTTPEVHVKVGGVLTYTVDAAAGTVTQVEGAAVPTGAVGKYDLEFSMTDAAGTVVQKQAQLAVHDLKVVEASASYVVLRNDALVVASTTGRELGGMPSQRASRWHLDSLWSLRVVGTQRISRPH